VNIDKVIDPVLGDNEKLYVPEELVPLYKEQLCKVADIITPNGFEAEILGGLKPLRSTVLELFDRLHALGPSIVIITSVEEGEQYHLYGSSRIENVAFRISMEKKHISFSGTGDVFAALLLVHSEKYPIVRACERVVDTIQAILEKTISLRRDGCELALIQSANVMLDPPTIHRAELL
jgi:pyridoxine kinase